MEVLQPIVEAVAAVYAEPGFPIVAAAAAMAALVRGFAGFGAALVFMPLASMVAPPSIGVVIMLLVDGLLTAPLFVRALPRCTVGEVAPIAAGAVVTLPIGMYFLTAVDPIPLRWALSALALGAVAVLASGWRYARAPSPLFSAGVGGASGFLGGLASFYGPPIVIFWLAGQSGSTVVRANLIVFLGVMTVFSAISMAAYGLFTAEALAWCAAVAPIYAGALYVGSRMFPLAPEAVFRRVAYAIVAGAAVSGAPAWGAAAAAAGSGRGDDV